MQNNHKDLINNRNLLKENNKERAYSLLVQNKSNLKENTLVTGLQSDDSQSNEEVFNRASTNSPNINAKMTEKRPKSESPDILQINAVINKDEVLESLAKIFYETQMLSNDSPITKELVGIENAASKIHQDLKACLISLDPRNEDTKIDTRSPQEILTEAMGDVWNLRFCLEKLINTFEGIREKLYPPVEKVALIELEKNHYQIPGAAFKRIILQDSQVKLILYNSSYMHVLYLMMIKNWLN